MPPLYSTEDVPIDKKTIIVRFFNPAGGQVWQITEGSQEGEDWLLFGLCDLGMGFPEWGYVYLSELESIKVNIGRGQFLGIERDIGVGPCTYHPEWDEEVAKVDLEEANEEEDEDEPKYIWGEEDWKDKEKQQ